MDTDLIFIDLSKAYDGIPIFKLWIAVEKRGVRQYLIKAVQHLFSNSTGQTKVGKCLQKNSKLTRVYDRDVAWHSL